MHSGNSIIAWHSPANIALIKYWGKLSSQIPANPSISFTLDKSASETRVSFKRKSINLRKIEFYFNGERNEKFKSRILKYFNSLNDELPFLQDYDLIIESKNNFPHSTGIASSASSMSSLALCLASIEKIILNSEQDFYNRASYLARLGSGSACRSIYPKVVMWGDNLNLNSSDKFAIELKDVNPIFYGYRDSILIVSNEPKLLSSREGHKLMKTHPKAEKRFSRAKIRTKEMLNVLKKGDLNKFISIVEQESLDLHDLIMSSKRNICLMLPQTFSIINAICKYREKSGVPICFSLDAGPNVHLLYPEEYAESVRRFISDKLFIYLKDDNWIDDKVGMGPYCIENRVIQ